MQTLICVPAEEFIGLDTPLRMTDEGEGTNDGERKESGENQAASRAISCAKTNAEAGATAGCISFT